MKVIVIFLVIFSCSTGIAHSDSHLTIEGLLSSPFPSSMLASPAGDRAAWIFNDQGKRNIWIANSPELQAIQLTHYNNDDGQELGGLAFSKDGTLIAFVRGGDANSKQETPNPTSDPKGVKQEVWIISTNPSAGAEPKKLGEGSEPQISPDAKQVAFTKDGKIFLALVDASKQPSTLFEARGRNSNPLWSADGSRLAFVSDRGDHSYIGVYDFTKQKITWMSPSADRDFNPIWSSDGKRIAFMRFPGTTENPSSEIEPSIPFSIWIAHADSGEAKQIWESDDKTAGFAQTEYLEPPDRMFWWAGNRLVFYWEKDGWVRLYSVTETGGTLVALSPAKCEAEHATISADLSKVIFASNCNDIDRRHLWQVPIQGGAAQQVTSGSSLEWSPVSVRDKILMISSTATRPAAPAILASGSPRLIAESLLKNFPKEGLTQPEQVIFKAGDGLQIHGQLFLPPKSQRNGKHPAVIFMHGGPIREMLLGFHYMDYYHNTYAMNQYLASRGYVVLSVNYRSGIGYGRAFRTAADQGPKGASEYQDILAAAKFLQGRDDVNPRKIGLWGGSYGGYLTALGLARNSDIFAAGVDLHGVHDWSYWGKQAPGTWGMVGEEGLRLAFQSSPAASAAFWTSPVLFIHGDDDRNVDFIETTDMIQRLRAFNRAHIETLVFPDEVHDFLLHSNFVRAYHATADFFDRFLMKAK